MLKQVEAELCAAGLLPRRHDMGLDELDGSDDHLARTRVVIQDIETVPAANPLIRTLSLTIGHRRASLFLGDQQSVLA